MELKHTLQRMRAGDTAARRELTEYFQPLAKKFYRKHVQKLGDDWRDKARRDALRSEVDYDLVLVVRRLVTNHVAPEDIERAIRGELKHSRIHYYRSTSDDILPPKDAKDTTDENGNLVKPKPLKRQASGSGRYDDEELIELFDDPCVTCHRGCDVPSRLKQLTPDDMFAHEDQLRVFTRRNKQVVHAILRELSLVCKTRFEQKVVGLLSAGYDLDDLPKTLHGHTKLEINGLLLRLWRRAQ